MSPSGSTSKSDELRMLRTTQGSSGRAKRSPRRHFSKGEKEDITEQRKGALRQILGDDQIIITIIMMNKNKIYFLFSVLANITIG